MFDKVLIANRGAIACRIIRTLKAMGVRSVAVFSDADAGSAHVSQADEAVRIGPAPAAESYLDVDAILAAARATGAEAIHPGYGFLSENAGFAEACAAHGIAFIGPTPDNIRAFGLKHIARDLAAAQGVPLAPGTDLLSDEAAAIRAAAEIGYPVILKATAGGGGIGMKVCADEGDVRDGFATVARLGAGNFGDGGVFLERYVARARHIEVQVFGDGAGRVVALGERDCSLQRRNQKVVEETPAPLLPDATRRSLIEAAVRLTAAADYLSAGTVEFLYDAERDDFFFLEVNTRLQVEHGVTEQVTGIDLVEWMVRAAAGDFHFLDGFEARPHGASIQVRLYAEDPAQDYRPSSGRLVGVSFPHGPRVDSWIAAGTEVSAWYDPMLAKLIVTAPTRAKAVAAIPLDIVPTRNRIDGYRGARRTVLVIDDDPAQTAVLQSLLRPFGFVVYAAGSGSEGLALAERCAPDLVLLDVQMPGIGGWETAERLRAAQGGDLKIVMVSANVEERRAHAGGDDRPEDSQGAFLAKPFDFAALLAVIGAQLRLTWESKGATPTDDGTPSNAPLPAEARPFVEQLRHLAEIGHVGGIERQLANFEREIPSATSLIAELRTHLANFDLHSLLERLGHAERR